SLGSCIECIASNLDVVQPQRWHRRNFHPSVAVDNRLLLVSGEGAGQLDDERSRGENRWPLRHQWRGRRVVPPCDDARYGENSNRWNNQAPFGAGRSAPHERERVSHGAARRQDFPYYLDIHARPLYLPDVW